MLTKKFTYPLPDENFFPEVSGKRIGEFTYEGPEKFTVRLTEDGFVKTIDPSLTENENPNLLKEVDAHSQPEVAYLLYCVSEPQDYIYEDEILENGEVYKNITNPSLHEVYDVFYNFSTDSWELSVIVKELFNPAREIATNNRNLVKEFLDKYEFSEDVETKMSSYVLKLDEFISNLKDIPTWKYVDYTFDVQKIPKMPIDLAQEISKVKNLGV